MNRFLPLVFAALLTFCSAEILSAQGTAFTYQGQLYDGGGLANSNYDLTFTVYDSTNLPGNVIAGPVTNSAVLVTNGLFTATLDFGAGVFTGPDRWLQIAVRATNAANFTTLSPRQKLTSVPYAIFANTASNLLGVLPTAQLSGTLSSNQLSGTYSSTVSFTNSGNSFVGAFSGTFSGNGSSLSNLNASQLTSGTVADVRLSTNVTLLNTNQTFTGTNVFTGNNTFTGANTFTNFGNSFVGSFFGNGLVGWIATNGTAIQAQIDHGYLLTNSQLVTVTLPPSPNVGDIVRISGAGASGWKIKQNSGQSVLGNFSSFATSFWNLTDSGSGSWTAIASSSDGSHLAAVIFNGEIYVSSDSGLTWSGASLLGNKKWQSIASSADGSKLVAVVNGDGIYTNSGSSWAITGAPSTNWDAVASSADGTKLAAAVNGGGIYTSTNSGSTWKRQTSILPASPSWECIASSANGNTLIAAATSGGQIWVSSDSGQDWSAQSGTLGKNWQSVACSADGSKFVAVVNGGGIYTNSGAGWNISSAPNSASWASVAMSADGSKLAAVINSGGISTSSDYGATWQQQTNAPSLGWYSIASSSDGGKLAAAVNGGSIYVSQTSTQTTTTPGANGFITGGQGSAVELQYIGNNQFMPVSFAGTIWAY